METFGPLLIQAYKNGNSDLAAAYLEAGVRINSIPLWSFISERNLGALAFFLSNSAVDDWSPSPKIIFLRTLAERNDTAALEVFVSSGWSPRLLGAGPECMSSACRNGATSLYTLLIGDGIDPTPTDLFLAAMHSAGEAIVTSILSRGVRLDESNRLAILKSTAAGSLSRIIASGTVFSPDDLVQASTSEGTVVSLTALLDSGLPASFEAMSAAVLKGCTSSVNLLLSRPRVVSSGQLNSLLSVAAAIGNLDIVTALVNAGADPSSNESEPLRRAALLGSSDVVTYLLAHGARNTDRNFQAREWAHVAGRPEIEALL